MKKTLLLISVTILLSIGLQAQEWNFGNDSTNFPDYAGVPAGTTVTILGLDITAGATPTNMGLVEPSKKIFGTTTYHRRFKFNGGGYTGAAATDVTPTVNMPTQRYISFPVSGNSTILVHGITGSSSSARKLFVTDGTNYVGAMDMPAGSEITEATLTYTGPAATLYMFCNASINLYYLKVASEVVTPVINFVGEDFESIKLNLFAQGSTGTIGVVPNPDSSIANPSLNVGKMVRAKDGDPWQGWWVAAPTPFDASANKYVHVKLWKPRTSPIIIKYEILDGVGSLSSDVPPMTAQTLENGWAEYVFDMSAFTAPQVKITFIPDFPSPVGLTADIDIFFDDMYVNNDPTPGSVPVIMLENFETITMNYMGGGGDDLSTLTLVPNPDKSGINNSDYVIKFHRDMNGVPWGGFWSTLPGPADVTTNKYVHAKVWKPRISPVKLKLQDGAAGTLETPSMNMQSSTGAWEDFVFDFSSKTGTYPILAFMPDFEDPLTLTEDIDLYFDDIMINNDSNVMVAITLNVDMHGAGLTTGQKVYVAGNFTGWAVPDTKPEYEMLDADGDSIYTYSMVDTTGVYAFKFFKGGSGWNGGEWAGDPNRTLKVAGDIDMTYKWGVKSANLTLNVDMHGAKNVNGVRIAPGTPIYVSGDFKGDYGDWDLPGTNMMCMLTDADGDSIYTITLQLAQVKTHYFKFYSGDGWVGKETADFDRELVVTGDMTANYIWGSNGMVNTRQNALAGKIQMYPNPVRNELNINSTVDVRSILISNTLGKTVSNITYTGAQTINTSNLTKGMYFVTFIGRDGSKVTQKLIKD